MQPFQPFMDGNSMGMPPSQNIQQMPFNNQHGMLQNLPYNRPQPPRGLMEMIQQIKQMQPELTMEQILMMLRQQQMKMQGTQI